MLLIDTSVWINVFRDRTGQVRQKLEALINDRNFETLHKCVRFNIFGFNLKSLQRIGKYAEALSQKRSIADSKP